jgi:uncharacterized protein YggT (Ycf19 family)
MSGINMEVAMRLRILTPIIEFVVGLAELILAVRILLRLFAASPSAPFVHWVYTTSNTLLEPFRGIFPSTVINRAYVLDFTALFALLIYAIIGGFLIYLAAWIETAITPPAKR